VKNQANGGHFDPNKALRTRINPEVTAGRTLFNDVTAARDMDFTLQRGGPLGGETEWLINDLQFDPLAPLWAPTVNSFEHWAINNGGGGWTHPMHIHYEEHQVTYRSTGGGPIPFLQTNNADFSNPNHLEDGPLTTVTTGGVACTAGLGKEDVVNLEGSEQTHIYRGFRTFLGNYVAHCHNLAHEDHNMMFGWVIRPPL
jgi:FtsP/CotA-like multicopper oxidase with cupredoxin domain